MAEFPVYEGLGRDTTGGTLIMGAPEFERASEPDVTPASPWTPEDHVTTADVQRSAEGAAGELQDGAVLVPFGPEISREEAQRPGWMALDDGGVLYRAFRVAESIGMMPLLRFAHAAKSGMDTDDMEGMAALYTMIRDTVHPDDWETFQEYATEVKAEDEELLSFVSAAIEVISARKAKQRGSSSGTSPNTSAKSKGSLSRPGSVIPPGTNVPAEAAGLMPVGDLVKR